MSRQQAAELDQLHWELEADRAAIAVAAGGSDVINWALFGQLFPSCSEPVPALASEEGRLARSSLEMAEELITAMGAAEAPGGAPASAASPPTD